jgi:ubiquitin-protein ligase
MDADILHLDRLRSESDVFSIESSDDEYIEFQMRCRGLMESGGRIRYTTKHRVGLYFPVDYPFVAPVVEWRTPLFHPNILGCDHPHHPGATCLGIWSPSVRIDSLIEHIYDLVSLRTYNIASPLNPVAAQWIRLNPHRIPVDNRPFRNISESAY